MTTTEKLKKFFVEVANKDTDEVVKRLGPMSKQRAGLVADGVLINLNHDQYAVQIVPEATPTTDKDD